MAVMVEMGGVWFFWLTPALRAYAGLVGKGILWRSGVATEVVKKSMVKEALIWYFACPWARRFAARKMVLKFFWWTSVRQASR
jgi:hypothetical protein